MGEGADIPAEASIGIYDAEPNSMALQYSESCEGERKSYSALVHVDYPFQARPMGGLRDIEAPSRQVILQEVSKIMSEHGLSNPVWPIKTLCVKHEDTAYDILGYKHDYIGSLLDDVLKSGKLPIIECVY
jgi:hypothetical protein